jgi:hypothetical protein
MGRDLTKSEVEKLHNTIYTNFPTDESVDHAFSVLASKMIGDPEIWDDWMNKNYPTEERKKKSSKSKPKRKPVKKVVKKVVKKCKCK